MANPNKYYSRWTGKQVDDAVGNAANAVTKDDIVQVQGNSPTKVMSQGAVSSALASVPSSQDIANAVSTHNGDSSAHPYLQGLINAKPNVTNSRSDSQTDTYSANYVNQNFAPLTFVSNLYATKVTNTTATLETARPSVDVGNVLAATTSNTTFDWTTPIFSFTRELENEVTLDNENSFTADIYFTLDKNTGMSWGAIISVSTDNGSTWRQISTQQSFGEMAYTANTLTYESLQIFTNALTGTEQYPIGTLLKIDLFTKFDTAHSVVNTICCGVTVDNADVYSYVQFNFTNVSIDTNQINDGAVTYDKLADDVKAKFEQVQVEVVEVEGSYAVVTDMPYQYLITFTLPNDFDLTSVKEYLFKLTTQTSWVGITSARVFLNKGNTTINILTPYNSGVSYADIGDLAQVFNNSNGWEFKGIMQSNGLLVEMDNLTGIRAEIGDIDTLLTTLNSGGGV